MAGTITWKRNYSKWSKGSSSWTVFNFTNSNYTLTGSLNNVGYLNKITISITNTSATGFYNDGRGEAKVSFYAVIHFGETKSIQSDTISKTFKMSGYKHTCTFPFDEIIPLSGSEAAWTSIDIYAKHTSSSTGDKETILFRDGGTLTVTYSYSEGIFKYYTDSNWQNCSVNYYDGEKWVQTQPYYYDGTIWIPTGA